MEFTSQSQKELDNSSEIKNLKKIEAMLFISARYLSIKELVELTDINPLLLKDLLDKIRKIYSEKESAIEVIEKNLMWKMDVKEEYHKMINKLATGDAEFTRAEQETLAVIAYKQPVKQSVLIKIRGNKAYEHVKHLIEVGLVKGKRIGHTKELTLSEEFYDYFNLKQKELGNSKEEIEKKIEEKVIVKEELKLKEEPKEEVEEDEQKEELEEVEEEQEKEQKGEEEEEEVEEDEQKEELEEESKKEGEGDGGG